MKKLINEFGDMNIFVDGGYFLNYTMFGAFKSWQYQYPARFKQRCPEKPRIENLPDVTNDDKFIACLQKKLEDNIDKLFGIIKNNVFDGFTPPGLRPKIYFCKDSKAVPYWRKTTLFPEYKLHRRLTKKLFDTGEAFKYLTDIIIPKLDIQDFFGIKTIEVPSAEADDILITLVKRMKHSNNVIICTDHDMIQIIDNARMFDMMGKEITMEYISSRITDKEILTPKKYLAVKFIMGDPSDGMKAIFDRCGPKTAYKLVNDPTLLRERLQNDKSAVKRLLLNKKLIDGNEIPLKIQKEIIMEYARVKAT